MERVLFPAGVPVFNEDFTTVELYRQTETTRRWSDDYRHGDAGVVADTIADDILFPTTGVTSGQIAISAGSVYFANGEYVSSTGGTVTGLTADSMYDGRTFIVVTQSVTLYAGRAHDITGGTNYTRQRNTTGDVIFSLAPLSGTTGDSVVILGEVDNITVLGLVSLSTDYDSGRRVSSPSTATKPTTPSSLTLDSGLDYTLEYPSTGDTEAVTGRSSTAYLHASWLASTHPDGLWGYVIGIELYQGAVTLSERTQFYYLPTNGAAHSSTGLTISGLHPGLRVSAKVAAISNSAVQVTSDWLSTGNTIVLGVGDIPTMPVATATPRVGGIELTWAINDPSTSGITCYEVFGSTSAAVTGTTTDYQFLVWRGYSSKAFVPAEVGEKWYFKIRGFDASGRVTSSYRIFSYLFSGPTAPPVPQNVRVYTGFVRNDNKESSSNPVATMYMERSSNYSASKLNRPYIIASWGWEGQNGSWTTPGVFNLTQSGLSLANTTGGTADLTGWYLVFSAYSDFSQYHRITGSTLTTVSCALIDGYNYDAVHSGKFWITPNANSYDVSLTVIQPPVDLDPTQTTGGGASAVTIPALATASPVTDADTNQAVVINGQVALANSPTVMNYRYDNSVPGYLYKAQVVSVGQQGRRSESSEAKYVVAGTIMQSEMPTVAYSVYGTQVTFTWNSVSMALGYEIAYTTNGANPSFDSEGSYTLFVQKNRVDISVQAGVTLRAIFRLVDQCGQISSNTVSASVTIGVPSGYYGLSAYNINVNYSSTAYPTTGGTQVINMDFPFPFAVRYASFYAVTSNLATGQTISFNVHPQGAPNAENHIGIDWISTNLLKTVREQGYIPVPADGAVDLTINGTGTSANSTWVGTVTLWYEQTSITPPVNPGSPGVINPVDPRTYASVMSGASLNPNTNQS